MLFVIFVIILIIGIAAAVYYEKSCTTSEFFCGFGIFGIVIGTIAVAVSLFIIGVNHFGIDGKIASKNQRYESLVYQYENDIYDNDNDLGKRELIVDIQEWNENLAVNREHQDDPWIGIYIPNIYDQFKFIELDKGE